MEPEKLSSAAADAAHHMAIKAAEGDGLPQDWAAALDHLQRSAQLGSRLAQAELAALSDQWGLTHDILAGEAMLDSRRARFHSAIGLTKRLPPPSTSTISAKPRLVVVKDIATPEMCDWLIARARPRLKPAQIYDDKEGRHRSASGRTNTACPFPGPERDLILAILRARVPEVTGRDPADRQWSSQPRAGAPRAHASDHRCRRPLGRVSAGLCREDAQGRRR